MQQLRQLDRRNGDHPTSRRTPTQLTPRLTHGFLDLVRAGLSVHASARALDISPNTLARWLRLGRHGGVGPNAMLYQALRTGLRDARAERSGEVQELIAAARERAGRSPV